MRWIYLSPHLDDSVLSAGGLIWEQTRAGDAVEIWTFMCGYPEGSDLSAFAQELHAEWGIASAADVVRARRAEDVKAAGLVGAKPIHLDFLDCIYRRAHDGSWMYADVFRPPHADDAELAASIAQIIGTRLQADDHVVCQLAIGSHVDHVLVRRAAELVGRPLIYLADIPYHFNFPDELHAKTAGMKESAQPVSDAGLTSWQDGIAAYASQMGMLFENPRHMRDQIQSYRAEGGGVRTWEQA